MSELLSKWASELGIPVDTVQKAVGGILSAMRGALPKETYQEVAEALPEGEEAVTAFESTECAEGASECASEAKQAGGGILSSLGGALSKAFGGAVKDSSPLVAYLASSGLSLDKVQSLAAKVVGYLKEKGIAPAALAQIEKVLPLPERETV
jgi:hypothetical protein